MNVIHSVHASSEAAAEAAAGQTGILASLGLDLKLFIFQLINFIIVAVILWFMILKPLVKKLAERQKVIDESLDNAKKVQDNLERSEQDYHQRLKEARAEAEKILERAGAESSGLAEEIKAKAKKEIEALVGQAKANIQREKEEMAAGLKRETADLVALALEKILAEKMTGERDKKMIGEIVGKLK